MRAASRKMVPHLWVRRQGERVGRRFMIVGATLIMLSFFAAINLLLTTIVTTYYVAAMMLAGGVVQIVHAVEVRLHMRAIGWGLAGGLYLFAAVVLLRNPLLSAAVLTLAIAAALAASGIVRCGLALVVRPDGWGLIMLSGLFSLAAAFVIALGWPVDGLWIPGLVLATDLLLQGVMYLVIGFLLRSFKRKF